MKKIKFGITVLVILTIIVVLAACQPSNPTPQPAGKVTVVFDLNGGEMSEQPTVQIDKGGYLKLPVPTRTGYAFIGWFVGEGVNAGQVTNTTAITQDITITAHWKANNYTVSFVETGDNAIADVSVTYGQDCALPTPIRTGYTFLGWFDGDNKIESGTWNIARNVTLVARWQANTYTVIFETGTEEEIEPMKVTFGESYTFPVLERTGYKFLGWYNGWNKLPQSGNWNADDIQNVVARWQANEYNLSFAETGDFPIDDITVTYDKSYTLPMPTRTGYKFLGWFEGENKVESGTWNRTQDLVLVAHWQANTYIVTFDTATEDKIDQMEMIFDQLYTLPTPIRVGYTFDGWYYGTTRVKLSGKWGFAGNISLLARWSETEYSVVYNNAEGCYNNNPNSVTISQLPYVLQDAGKNDHLFEGWYADPDFTTRVTQIDQLGMILYAKFTVATSGLQFRSNGSSVTVSGYNGTEKDIIIASYHNGFVKSIGAVAFQNSTITNVTIPSSVVTIDERTFYNCQSLKSVTFTEESQLQSIGDYAFYNCLSLSVIVIPSTVTNLGNHSFRGCNSLQKVSFIEKSQLQSIGDWAFRGCADLISIVIPAGVISVGEYTFGECDNLTVYCEIEEQPSGWNDNWNSSNCDVLWGCVHVTSNAQYNYVVSENKIYLIERKEDGELVEVPSEIEGVAVVDFKSIFAGSHITSVIIPASVTTIDKNAFKDCIVLRAVTFLERSNLKSIGDYAFYNCSSLVAIAIPSNVISIGENAFKNCTSLESVSFDEACQLQSIGDYAFCDCSMLSNIEIPNSVVIIGNGAFQKCTSVETVTFTTISQLKSIGCNAFRYCDKLNSIEIPAGIRSIGEYAFADCSSLELVNFSSGSELEVISCGMFSGCDNLTTIEIPASVEKIEYWAFNYCKSLSDLTFAEGSKLNTIGGSNFGGAFQGCSGLTSIEIPASVSSIGYRAFQGCSNLTIYCEAESQPIGWNADWNPNNCPVVWGYKG